jgi:non-ribosomal peptide synthetase component E (peptide arylation enzyme)
MNLVEKLSAQPPEQTAIIDSRRAVSFSELTKRAQGGAAFLKKKILNLETISSSYTQSRLSCTKSF